MLRSSLSLCLKKAAAMDAAAAASMTAQRRHAAAGVTLLTSRASSYASSSSNASSDADSAVSSPTYFSSLSLANPSVQTSAPYSSSAATANIRTTTYQVPSGMGTSPAQCYRSVEDPTLHEDYDGLELHHTVSEKTHASYYNYSYEPEESFEEMGPIL
ncbi:hypothetical protein QTG54_001660 [Skeletonema marinoi]|uniref:Uncharacterized protein n=1 Tax=Skeletonema marinoi TaxID=267567 RepID=A0AAD8YLW9_9STRA|nr:hypothetical protein QTG54_001660 [Skeletonema marinoi]|mmetsp:Transcript_21106/g.31763  ORF Transcript_21106/g.31763 Transcript_21106/m.31763 type:complete len:158 (-) Transcript_21106:102-575(-)|eukprot:scaffold647_cov118-Skeletonema_marinoi.AAC.3